MKLPDDSPCDRITAAFDQAAPLSVDRRMITSPCCRASTTW
jgi:hypothetical protein